MKTFALLGLGIAASALGACGGGGSSPVAGAGSNPTSAPTLTPSTAQVISLALPSTAIGRQTDPTFGAIAGYTQQQFSQVMGFAPGMHVMIRNGDSLRPHTLGDTGATSFPAGQPATLSTTASGTATFGAGWQSGTLNPGALIGPITLQSGTYFIGCAFHYASDGMRDVLVVAAGATPGAQATPPPGTATPSPSPGGGYGY